MEKALLVDAVLLIVSVAVAVFFMGWGDTASFRWSKVRVRSDERDRRQLPEPSQEEWDDTIMLLGLMMACIIMAILAQALQHM